MKTKWPSTFHVGYTGWWFQTCFIFHNIRDNPSHWRIFFRMVKTTNQYKSVTRWWIIAQLHPLTNHLRNPRAHLPTTPQRDHHWFHLFTPQFLWVLVSYGMSSFPLTNSYFPRWLKPPTSIYLLLHSWIWVFLKVADTLELLLPLWGKWWLTFIWSQTSHYQCIICGSSHCHVNPHWFDNFQGVHSG